MKKTLAILLLWASASWAIDFGPMGLLDTLRMPIYCYNDTARQVIPDSVIIHVWAATTGANATTFSNRTGATPASQAWIDTVIYAGAKQYNMIYCVDDIDGGGPNGPYTGNLACYSQAKVTDNPFSFTKIGSGNARGLWTVDIKASDTVTFVTNVGTLTTNNDKTGYKINGGAINNCTTLVNVPSSIFLKTDTTKLRTDFWGGASRTLTTAPLTPGDTSALANNIVSNFLTANGIDTLLKNNRDSVTAIGMAVDVIDGGAIKDGALTNDKFGNGAFDSTNFGTAFYRGMQRYMWNIDYGFQLSWNAYSPMELIYNQGQRVWSELLTGVYDEGDSAGTAGYVALQGGTGGGAEISDIDTLLDRKFAQTFVRADSAVATPTDTTQSGFDLTGITGGGSNISDIDTLLDRKFAQTFVREDSATVVVQDTTVTGDTIFTVTDMNNWTDTTIASISAMADSFQGRTFMVDSGSVDVATNGSSFGSTINGSNFINRKYTNQWLVFEDQVVGPIMQRITGIVADSSWFWISPGLATAPVQGTKFKVLYSAVDTTLTPGGGTVSLGDSLEVLAMKLDTLQHMMGMAGGSMVGEYTTSIGNYLTSMQAYIDTVRGIIGLAGGSATWEYPTSLGNYLYDLRQIADSIRYVVGDPNVSFIGEYTNSVCNMIGAYTGVGTSTIKGDIAAISAGSCGGTGSDYVRVYVASGATMLSSIPVTVTEPGGSRYFVSTNVSGYAPFSLNPGTYTVLIGSVSYVADDIPFTLTVAADSTFDTLTVTARTVSSPSNPNQVQVYIYSWNVLGDTLSGATFRAVPRTRNRSWSYISGADTVAIVPQEETALTDSTGKAYLNMLPSTYVKSGADSLLYDFYIDMDGATQWRTTTPKAVPNYNWWVH